MKTEILKIAPPDSGKADYELNRVCEALSLGEVVALPSETVYGLAAVSSHQSKHKNAIEKIYQIKERPSYDPLILHVADSHSGHPTRELIDRNLIDGSQMTPEMINLSDRLIFTFWPGPLTLVYPKHASILDSVTAGLPTVALRMPKHPVFLEILKRIGEPIAAPSANRFGRISPTRPSEVMSELGGRIPYIVDGGRCDIGVESTIAAIEPNGQLRILRPGGTSLEALGGIAKVIFQKKKPTKVEAPGMLEQHYSPQKPLFPLKNSVSKLTKGDWEGLLKNDKRKIGLLISSGDAKEATERLAQITGREVVTRALSRRGSIEEAAHNLYGEMRWLDQSDADILFYEPFPVAKGLGTAIRDRLKRASSTA